MKLALPYLKEFKNSFWMIFDKIVRLFLGLIVSILLARYLGTEGFGAINLYLSLFIVISSIYHLGFNVSVVSDITKKQTSIETIMGSSLLFSSLFSLILIFFYISISISFFNNPEYIFLAYIFSLMFLFKGLEVCRYFFEAKLNSKIPVIFELIPFILFSLFKIVAVFFGYSLFQISLIIMLESLTGMLFLLFAFHSLGVSLQKLKYSFSYAAKTIEKNYSIILSSVSIIIFLKIDQIMLGYFSNLNEVGIYSVALRLSESWFVIITALTLSFRPSMTPAYSSNFKEFEKKFSYLLKILLFISFSFAFLISFTSDILILALFGDSYTGSSDILKIHSWTGIFIALNAISWNWHIPSETTSTISYRLFLSLILNIFLNYLLIPKYGAIGAAYATLISKIFLGFIGIILLNKSRPLFWLILKSVKI